MSTLAAQLLTQPHPTNPTIHQPKLLTIKEAAIAVGVNPMTLRRWEKAGLFTALRTPGGKRRYHPETINRIHLIHLTPPIPSPSPLVHYQNQPQSNPLHHLAIAFSATMLFLGVSVLGVSAIEYFDSSGHPTQFSRANIGYNATQVLGSHTSSYATVVEHNLQAFPTNLRAFYAGFLQSLPNPFLLVISR